MLRNDIFGDRTVDFAGVKSTGIVPEFASTALCQPLSEGINRQDMTDKITFMLQIIDKLDLGMMDFAEMSKSLHLADYIKMAPDLILLAHGRQTIMKPAQRHLLSAAIPDQHFIQAPPLVGLRFAAAHDQGAKDLLCPDLKLADAAQGAAVFITAGESKKEVVNGTQAETLQSLQKDWADPAK